MLVAALGVRYWAQRRLKLRLERLEQQQALAKERTRIARDIHDDLGAGLTQIVFQSALARRDSQHEMQNHLGQISNRASEMIEGMDEIVWAINPQNDTLESLIIYLSKYVHEFLSAAGIRCRLDIPELIPPHPLSPDVRHNIFMTIKEALNNIVKHAHAGEVQLQLRLEPARMAFLIVDDGGGFDPARISTSLAAGRTASGNGLGNMIRRMESIGGSCVIRSQPAQGTTIELTMRLLPATHTKR
jgi:signal transduction histidine kinase